MTDPIQHLRELMAKATPGPWCCCHTGHMECREIADLGGVEIHSPSSPFLRSGWEDDAALIVALRNAAPALLAVAEAARHHEIVRNRCAPFDEYEASRKVLQDALAKLAEVKP